MRREMRGAATWEKKGRKERKKEKKKENMPLNILSIIQLLFELLRKNNILINSTMQE